MVSPFFVEFTGDDRIKFEPKMSGNQIRGLRIKYQTAKKTEKVNYSIKGVEPFFEYDWLNVVKYDNLKGESIKDLTRPTPVTYSPHGLHIKENWGVLDNFKFIEKVLEDMKGWVELRTKFDSTLLEVDNDRKRLGDKNLERATALLRYMFAQSSMEELSRLYPNQTLIPIPLPEEDDWILEETSVYANRIEKRAHKGDPDIFTFGSFKVLTYQKSGEENQ